MPRRPGSQAKPTTGGVIIGSDYDEARTRKINAEAQIAELELAKLRQILCLTDDVVKAWEGVVHAAKTKLLAVPVKIAPLVAAETDIAVVKDTLENAIREALAELSNYQPSVDPVKSVAAPSEVPPEPEEKPKRGRGRPRKTATLAM